MTSAIPPAMLDGVRRMNGSNRFLTLVGLVLALGVIWAAVKFGGTPQLVTLYSGLDLREAGEMTDLLQKNGIRYELDLGGSEIRVEPASMARARVLLAQSGLPTGGAKKGDELLDGQTWGKTEQEMRLLERRALEGELARTIAQFHGVERAVVHLGLPESSPLRKLERPAKASVVITLRGGRQMTSEEVNGITYLVANAVPQLSSDQVAVLDSDMRLLSGVNDGSARGLTSRQLEMQRSVEEYLAQNAEKILGTALGQGGARVQVAARLNFEQVDKTVETYNPDGAVLQNEQRSETVGADSIDGGSSTIVNNTYLNSRVVEKVAGSVGGIERLTVAVLLDNAVLARVAPGQDPATLTPRYEQLVRDAIGMDSARGDRITVTAMPFEQVLAGPDSLTEEPKGTEQVIMVAERFSRPVIGLVGIIAALILALRVLKPGPAPRGGTPTLGGTPAGGGAFPAASIPEPELPPVSVPALNAVTNKLKNEVQAESTQRPEMAASVVKAWLTEG